MVFVNSHSSAPDPSAGGRFGQEQTQPYQASSPAKAQTTYIGYRTQIQELPTCVIVNREIEPNILTEALPPSKSRDHSPRKDSTYP